MQLIEVVSMTDMLSCFAQLCATSGYGACVCSVLNGRDASDSVLRGAREGTVGVRLLLH